MTGPVLVVLDPEERQQAGERAAELGISMPEYLRRLVRADLEVWEAQASDEPIAIISIDDAGEPMPPRPDASIGEAVAARIARADR